MKAVYDVQARKRSVNLSLNEDLVAQARQWTGNLSAEVEQMLAAFVEQKRRSHDAERENLRRAAAAWNKFVGRHGSLSDEFSGL